MLGMPGGYALLVRMQDFRYIARLCSFAEHHEDTLLI